MVRDCYRITFLEIFVKDYLLSDKFIEMDASKEEFKRLLEVSGWSQTEAADKLGKTPGAINHLLNPDHPNKPPETTLRLMKLLIARERGGHFDERNSGSKGAANRETSPLTARERGLIDCLRALPREEQERIYAVIDTMLGTATKVKAMKGKKQD
jgi:transcriptional regulator with XRE-family HTH domain